MNIILIPEVLETLLYSDDSCDIDCHPDRISAMVFLIGYFLVIDQVAVHYVHKRYYVRINARKLKSFYKEYKYVIEYLKKKEIIQVYDQYFTGFSPKSYRFEDNVLNVSFIPHKLTDKCTIDSIKRVLEKKKQKDTNIYPALRKWIKKRELAFPRDYLSDTLKQVYDNEYIKCGDVESTEIYCLGCTYKLFLLEEGFFWFVKDEFGNRLHTNLTNMNGLVRKALRYGGKQLVEIDIKNSQPYLMLKGLFDYYSKDSLPTDVEQFKELVVKGDLYSYFVNTLIEKKGEDVLMKLSKIENAIASRNSGFKYGTRSFRDRNKLLSPVVNYHKIGKRDAGKSLIFKIIFGRHNTNSIEKKMFAEVFPNVWRYIEEVKQDDYKELSKILQRAESKVVLNVIVKL